MPGGKEQLALEAIDAAGRDMARLFALARRAPRGAPGYVRAVTRGLARWMEDSDYAEGCPIASLTLEVAASSERLRLACRDAYRQWRHEIREALLTRGLRAPAAEDVASLLVSGMNGAMICARAERSTAPFRTLGERLARGLVRSPASDSSSAPGSRS